MPVATTLTIAEFRASVEESLAGVDRCSIRSTTCRARTAASTSCRRHLIRGQPDVSPPRVLE
jgi:hypothetical protein